MLGNSQDQATASNSTALQAGRDIHYHGLSLADVQTACSFFMENNFPRLQEAARLQAEEHVRSFASKLSDEMNSQAAKILVDKFSDPDVQATMNDAVKACARRGESASPDLLAKLLVHRMADNTPFLDTVLAEAVTVVPKLSRAQLAFLAYVHVTRWIFPTSHSYAALDGIGKVALPLVQPGFGLSKPQKLHLQYVGAINIHPLMGGDIYERFYEGYKQSFGVKSVEELKGALRLYCPSYNILLANFTKNELFQVEPTSVGFAIAISLLKQVLPLDFSSWIN